MQKTSLSRTGGKLRLFDQIRLALGAQLLGSTPALFSPLRLLERFVDRCDPLSHLPGGDKAFDHVKGSTI
jgi:hypothetical protein